MSKYFGKFSVKVILPVFIMVGSFLLLNSPVSFQASKQNRYFSVINRLDEIVEGGEAYKNYLRASIFNETVNANIGDEQAVEYLALVLRGNANLGIAQVGPSGDDSGFVDRWLQKKDISEFSLLTKDELNVLAKDAYVIERQIGEIEENYNYVKTKYGIECAANARFCDEIWTDQEAVRKVTQDSGHSNIEKVEDHHERIWNLNCNGAGSNETDFENYDLLKNRIFEHRNTCV